jgi:short-subunit dehydrogenase
MDITGRSVLLAGATGGIGHAIAVAFADRGARLTLSGRREDELQRLASLLGATAVAADLSDAASVQRLAREAGRVDILVTAFGLPGTGDLSDFTVEQVDRAIDVNLRAPVALTHAVLPAMLERHLGHVVLVGSLSGKMAQSRTPLYNATKFGLRGFCLGLHQDLSGTGVGVSVVQPGYVREAGYFAETGATPPPGAGTVTAEQVASGVLRAIKRNLAEVNPAPLSLRVVAALSAAFPSISAAAQQSAGAKRSVRDLVEGTRHNR